MRPGRALLASLLLALLILPANGEDYLSIQNVYAPPEKGAGSGGAWVSGPSFGFGMGGAYFGGAIVGTAGDEGQAPGFSMQMGPTQPSTGFPGGMPGGGMGSPQMAAPPPMPDECVYSSVIKNLGSAPVRGDAPVGGGQPFPSQNTSGWDTSGPEYNRVYQDAKAAELAKLESERAAARVRLQQEISSAEARRRDLEKERNSIRLSDSAGANRPEVDERTIAIDRQILEIEARIAGLRDRADSDEYLYGSRRQSIEGKMQELHPVLKSIYRNQEALAGDGSLRPFVRELVSYTGFAMGGPAGLVVGSAVGTLLGGGIDKVLAKIKELLSKPQPRIEELVPLIQEVCRWRKFNQEVGKSLVDQTQRTQRKAIREQVLGKIALAEEQLLACSKEVPTVSEELERLDSLMAVINNRVKQGKLSLRAQWSLIQDLEIPADVRERLTKNEDASVSGLLNALFKARLSRSQFVRAYSRDAVELNLGLLQQIRQTAESSTGNLSPDDSLQLQMILQSASNRLKTHELELQTKLVAVLDTEKNAAIEQLKMTYKEGTPALTNALIQVELPYVIAMRKLHERHNELQKDSASQEVLLLRILEEEKRKLAEEQARSPLKVKAADSEPSLVERTKTLNACSAEELQRGCKPEKTLWAVSCKCT